MIQTVIALCLFIGINRSITCFEHRIQPDIST
jgi:hypothetical protein